MLRMASKPWDEKRIGRRVIVQTLSDVGMAPLHGPHGLLTWLPKFHGALQDASVTGIQVLAEQRLQVGAAMTLWIKTVLNNEVVRLKLCGDVAWARPLDANGHCLVGIRFRATPKSHMKLWQRSMLEKMREADRAEMS